MIIIIEEDICCTVYQDGVRPIFMEGLCYRELNDYNNYRRQATVEYTLPESNDVISYSADVQDCVVEGGDAFYIITPGGDPKVEKKEKIALFLEVLDNENVANNVYGLIEQAARMNGYDVTTKRDEQKKAIALVLSDIRSEYNNDTVTVPYLFEKDLNKRRVGLDYSLIPRTYALSLDQMLNIRNAVHGLIDGFGQKYTFNFFCS